MRGMGISSQIRQKWTSPTQSSHSWVGAENLLARRFSGWDLNQAWVSDITYLPSSAGWLYLTTVMDLADRQVIGWALSKGLQAAQTSVKAFKEACHRRPPAQPLLFHSDAGVQYACAEFRQLLSTHKHIVQSMSRKGNCWDNAPAESFFKTFKAELPVNTRAMNYRQVRAVVFEFIELWYNSRRLHSFLDYRSPREMQQLLSKQTTTPA